MAKYMSKENIYRYSWNWGWVWRGFVKDWQRLKRLYDRRWLLCPEIAGGRLLTWWRHWLKGYWQPDFSLLPEAP